MVSGEGGVWPIPAKQEPGTATYTKVIKSTYQLAKPEPTPCVSNTKFIVYVFRSARTRMPPASRGGTPVTQYDNHYSTSPQPNTDPERY